MKGRREKEKTRPAWREAMMPTAGANAIIMSMFTGSGLCSSQGLPLKRVESSLQDINKPRGRQRPQKTEWQQWGYKFISILFIVFGFSLSVKQELQQERRLIPKEQLQMLTAKMLCVHL